MKAREAMEMGLEVLHTGLAPVSRSQPQATNALTVEFLNRDRTVLHPIHQAKVNLLIAQHLQAAAAAEDGEGKDETREGDEESVTSGRGKWSGEGQTLWWAMLYLSLRNLPALAAAVNNALTTVILARLPEKVAEVVQYILSSANGAEVESRMEYFGKTFHAQLSPLAAPPAEATDAKSTDAKSTTRLAPELPTSPQVLSEVFTMAALCGLERSNAFSAIVLFRLALIVNPREPLARMGLSKLYAADGNEAAAREVLTSWISLSPKAFDPRFELAKMASQEKPANTGEVFRQLDEALKIRPEAVEARALLVETLLAINEPSQALTHCEYLLKHNDTADLHFKMGQAYWQMEKGESAITAFRRAVTLDPKHSMAWMSLHTAMKAKGYDLGSQEFALRQALAADPKNIKAHTELAQLYLQNKRRNEAKVLLAKVFKLRGEAMPKELENFASPAQPTSPTASSTAAPAPTTPTLTTEVKFNPIESYWQEDSAERK